MESVYHNRDGIRVVEVTSFNIFGNEFELLDVDNHSKVLPLYMTNLDIEFFSSIAFSSICRENYIYSNDVVELMVDIISQKFTRRFHYLDYMRKSMYVPYVAFLFMYNEQLIQFHYHKASDRLFELLKQRKFHRKIRRHKVRGISSYYALLYAYLFGNRDLKEWVYRYNHIILGFFGKVGNRDIVKAIDESRSIYDFIYGMIGVLNNEPTNQNWSLVEYKELYSQLYIKKGLSNILEANDTRGVRIVSILDEYNLILRSPYKNITNIPDYSFVYMDEDSMYLVRKANKYEALFSGEITNCCIKPDDVGSSLLKSVWFDPNVDVYVVTDNGNIVAQSVVIYYPTLDKYVFDSVEYRGTDIYVYAKALAAFTEHYNQFLLGVNILNSNYVELDGYSSDVNPTMYELPKQNNLYRDSLLAYEYTPKAKDIFTLPNVIEIEL